MWISKKAYEREIALMEMRLADAKLEHQVQIKALRSQIEDLRKLVFAPTSATNIPAEAREADAVISVSEKPIERPDSDMSPDDAIQFDLIISGEHEEGFAH